MRLRRAAANLPADLFPAELPPGDHAPLASAVAPLANSLALTVVAEGVENAAQLDFLIAEGCHGAQGFFMAKPMEERLLTDHLAARRGAPHPLAARTAKARRQAG